MELLPQRIRLGRRQVTDLAKVFVPPAHRASERGRGSGGDIEASREAVHGDPKSAVGPLEYLIGHAVALVSKDDCYLLVELQRVQASSAFTNRGSPDGKTSPL